MVRPFVPSELPIDRCLRMGIFVGVANDILSDYAVTCLGGTPLLAASVWQNIKASVPGLCGYPTVISSRQKQHIEMIELQVQGTVNLAQRALPPDGLKVCDECGQSNILRLEPSSVVLNESSVPWGLDYFDVFEHPVCPIVSERLANAIAAAKVRNVRFTEIPMVSE
jgi:hypothetical protein